MTADSRLIPGGAPVWEDFDIQILDHDNATLTAYSEQLRERCHHAHGA
ncbi:hypothetical protein LP420_40365 [Massilia sp. B-10]|nr:hypothetical protein LP420_40365 [Massilia sp. B-10]